MVFENEDWNLLSRLWSFITGITFGAAATVLISVVSKSGSAKLSRSKLQTHYDKARAQGTLAAEAHRQELYARFQLLTHPSEED